MWKSAACLGVGRVFRGADQSGPLGKQSRSAAGTRRQPPGQRASVQCMQRRGVDAAQLFMQAQLPGMAPPAKALQRSRLPQPALHVALVGIPAPLHHRAGLQAVRVQAVKQLPLDLRWAQAITALPFQRRSHRLIQHPGTDLLQGGPEAWSGTLLRGAKATTPPCMRCLPKSSVSVTQRHKRCAWAQAGSPVREVATGSRGPSRSER